MFLFVELFCVIEVSFRPGFKMEKECSKKVRSSKIQIRMLVDYMVTHKNFANGEFSGPLGTQQYQAQWEQLSASLSEHGPQKSAEQWRTTWRDLKRRAREEGAKFKKASAATGNSVLIPTISEISEKILGVIGQEMAFGITNSQESGIGTFLTETSANACSSNTITSFVVPNTLIVLDEPLSPVEAPATSSCNNTRRMAIDTSPRQSTSQHTNESQMTMARSTPRPVAQPVSMPPPTAAPQRRVGLGERAAEFLAAEEATTGVLKDILNTLQSQNRMKRQQWIREERIRCARKF